MPRPKKTSVKSASVSNSISSYVSKIENEFQSNQSKVSMILGALIILVVGVLVFNFFNKNKPTLGPAQQTQVQTQESKDVTKDQLPGKYTVKDGDTLFNIAQNYYSDGSKFEELAKVNNLTNPDEIAQGQVLQIPKLAAQIAQATSEPTTQPTVQPTVAPSVQPVQTGEQVLGTGGGNSTIWGPRIEGNTYTVVGDDWLSKIAGRAYGDVMAFDKIAKANNIQNPDHIEPGQILVIPR